MIYQMVPFPITSNDPFTELTYVFSGYGPPGNPGPRQVHNVYTIVRHCPPWKGGNYEREGAAHRKVQEHYVVSCAETAEPIEMPLGIWKYVLGGMYTGAT